MVIPGRVGKLHAITQKVKRTKIKGTVVTGKYQYREFVYYLNPIILWILLFYEFNYNLFFNVIGVDSMATKEAKKRMKICHPLHPPKNGNKDTIAFTPLLE